MHDEERRTADDVAEVTGGAAEGRRMNLPAEAIAGQPARSSALGTHEEACGLVPEQGAADPKRTRSSAVERNPPEGQRLLRSTAGAGTAVPSSVIS